MKIYTRSGDKGKTSIVGKRVLKNNKLINFLGKLDELNCTLSIVICYTEEKPFKDKILSVQSKIFEISSVVAGTKLDLQLDKTISELENCIDLWSAELPELKNFILPGGSKLASFTHLARSVCRECERVFFDLLSTGNAKNILMENIKDLDDLEYIGSFLNRLSDWLFTLARKLNMIQGVPDTIWKM